MLVEPSITKTSNEAILSLTRTLSMLYSVLQIQAVEVSQVSESILKHPSRG